MYSIQVNQVPKYSSLVSIELGVNDDVSTGWAQAAVRVLDCQWLETTPNERELVRSLLIYSNPCSEFGYEVAHMGYDP